MNAAKRTPGPIVWDDDRGCQVMLCGDARIAVDALPALLDALQAIVRRVNDGASYGMGSAVDALARAAIAKATGGAS